MICKANVFHTHTTIINHTEEFYAKHHFEHPFIPCLLHRKG